MKKGCYLKVLFLGLVIFAWGCATQPKYDLILRHGLIYDGSGGKPVAGDVGIKDDRILALGDLGSEKGTNELDLKGKAVAPGFINMLSWANTSLIEDGRSMSDIKQGVTLEVMGEGFSMGPLTEAMKEKMVQNQRNFKFDVSWTTLGEYLNFLEKKGVSTNFTSFLGNGTVREYVIGMENRPATEAEMEEMKTLVRQAMEEGAVGLSSALLYEPSNNADMKELIELSKAMAPYGGLYISHMRSEGDELLEAIDELISVAREARVPAEIYHLKASGKSNWSKMDQAIEKINQARADGLAITADMYTYPASSTGLHVQLPDWVREGGVDAAIGRLRDETLRQKIVSEIKFSNPPHNIMLVGFKNDELKKYSGWRLDEVAKEWGITPAEAVVDLIAKDGSRIQVIYFSMSEENIPKKLALPWVSFCSDAGSRAAEGDFVKQSTHPRAYGSFIRVLGKFVRDEKVISLEEAVRKLAALPAINLHLKDRGMLKPGYFADIVVFDSDKVADRATFEKPHQYAEGVIHVWVNGVQVLKDGEHTGATPGRFVKGPGFRKAPPKP